MEHYLLTARSITHAQRMAQVLERAGIHVQLRRAGNSITKNGCGYTIQVPARLYRRAVDALREAGVQPVRVIHVSGGVSKEFAL